MQLVRPPLPTCWRLNTMRAAACKAGMLSGPCRWEVKPELYAAESGARSHSW